MSSAKETGRDERMNARRQMAERAIVVLDQATGPARQIANAVIVDDERCQALDRLCQGVDRVFHAPYGEKGTSGVEEIAAMRRADGVIAEFYRLLTNTDAEEQLDFLNALLRGNERELMRFVDDIESIPDLIRVCDVSQFKAILLLAEQLLTTKKESAESLVALEERVNTIVRRGMGNNAEAEEIRREISLLRKTSSAVMDRLDAHVKRGMQADLMKTADANLNRAMNDTLNSIEKVAALMEKAGKGSVGTLIAANKTSTLSRSQDALASQLMILLTRAKRHAHIEAMTGETVFSLLTTLINILNSMVDMTLADMERSVAGFAGQIASSTSSQTRLLELYREQHLLSTSTEIIVRD
jgi:hypothetical protein